MHKVLPVFLIMVSSIIFAGCTLPFGLGKGKQGALQVTSNPKTNIFLNDNRVGSSPYFDEKIKPGEYRIKLVPESGGQTIVSWEGQIKLVAGVLTAVSRDLGESEDKSSGFILSLEPGSDKNNAVIAVVTQPDGAVVTLDGEPKGFAPLSVDKISEGDHTLDISSPGYVEKSVKAKTVKGYKLVASVQLAKMDESQIQNGDQTATASAEASPSASPQVTPKGSPKATPKATPKASPAAIDLPYVLIKSPTTGWVRVRDQASTSGKELTKVNSGEQYKYLDSQNGWYQIEYEAGKDGWISGQYAELFK